MRLEVALQRELATGGSVNVIRSPAIGSKVSASSSRTRSATLAETPASVVALLPSSLTRVAALGTISSSRRSGMTAMVKATGAAPRSGVEAARWKGTGTGRGPAVKVTRAIPSSSVITSAASIRAPPASPSRSSKWMRPSGTGPASSWVKTTWSRRASSGWSVRSSLPTSASVNGLTPAPGMGLAGSVAQAIMLIDRIAE